MAFLRRDDVDPFVQAMVGHARFEAIHPFRDGNGRTGRALIHAHLRRIGLTRDVIVPISAGLFAFRDRYAAAIAASHEGELSPIIALGADAVDLAIANARRLAEDVEAIVDGWRSRTSTIRAGSVVHRIVADLPRHPVTDVAAVQRRVGVSTSTARRALGRLAEAGVLTQDPTARRARTFIADDLADALDAFAARAGQRTWLV